MPLVKLLSPSCCAQATVEFGGSNEQRILVIKLACVADSLALLVTDAKGRIHFVTSQLASMVGYSVKVLTDGMNLAGLLPPPYSQLHSGFMKVRPAGSSLCQQHRVNAVSHRRLPCSTERTTPLLQ